MAEMRVLVLWDGRADGSADGSVASEVPLNLELLSALSGRFDDVLLVCRSRGHRVLRHVNRIVPAIAVHHAGGWEGRPSIADVQRAWREFRRLIRPEDLVFVVGPGVLAAVGAAAATCSGVDRERIVYLVNSFPSQSLSERRKRRGATLVDVVAARLLDGFTAQLVGKLIVVSGALARRRKDCMVMPEIQWAELKSAINSYESGYRSPGPRRASSVLFVGRLEPEKGALVLARVASRIKGLESITFIGEGADRESIEAATRQLGQRVRFIGAATRLEVYSEMLRSEVAVVPSTTEGFGLVAFEASVLGAVIVAADVGGLREAVADRPVIWWAGDEETLGTRIDRALEVAARLDGRTRVTEPRELERIAATRGWETAQTIAALYSD